MQKYKKILSDLIRDLVDDEVKAEFSQSQIFDFVETPPKGVDAEFAFPCFHFSKIMRKSPNAVAEEFKIRILDADLSSQTVFEVSALGPYINFKISAKNLRNDILSDEHLQNKSGKNSYFDFFLTLEENFHYQITDADLGLETKTVENYRVRDRVSCIIFDDQNRVGLLYSDATANGMYILFPGGGVDEGESELDALHRELLEETGFAVCGATKIGIIEDQVSKDGIVHRTHQYIAKFDKKISDPNFIGYEKDMNFQLQRLTIDEIFAEIKNLKYENFSLHLKKCFELVLGWLKSNGAKKYLVEHVGANPNKPLHIGQARNTCIGDSVIQILKFMGHMVHSNSVGNDYGVNVGYNIVGHLHYGFPTETVKNYS